MNKNLSSIFRRELQKFATRITCYQFSNTQNVGDKNLDGKLSMNQDLKSTELQNYFKPYSSQFTKELLIGLEDPQNAILADLMLGSMVGAALGDAMGTTVEFRRVVTPKDIEVCLQVVGNGVFNLDPGQVTDDTQMAHEIAHAIMQMINNKEEFNIEKIAKNYFRWQNSPPFDQGITTTNAFNSLYDDQVDHENQIANQMIESSELYNKYSESNGAIMRSSPLAVYGVFLKSMRESDMIFRKDISLTHSQDFTQEVGSFYCLLIRELMLLKAGVDGKKRETALQNVLNFAQENFQFYQEIAGWVEEGRKEMRPDPSSKGHIKNAFQYTIYCLMNGLTYSNSMRKVLSMAGDTDTDCAIVGAVIGCCEGFLDLPKQKEIVLQFDPTRPDNRQERPEQYDSKYFLKYTGTLIQQLENPIYNL